MVGTAVAAMAICVAVLSRCRVEQIAADVMQTSRAAAATMRDRRLDDSAREIAIRRAALRLFARGAALLLRLTLAVAAASVPIVLANLSGVTTTERVLGFLTDWPAAVIATVMAVAAYSTRAPR